MARKSGTTHTMPDGTVHPYATHEEYVKAMRKRRITKNYRSGRRKRARPKAPTPRGGY